MSPGQAGMSCVQGDDHVCLPIPTYSSTLALFHFSMSPPFPQPISSTRPFGHALRSPGLKFVTPGLRLVKRLMRMDLIQLLHVFSP
jgi:hypothetical protein